MPLTAEEEEQVRRLLARESAQEQKLALASKANFKNWLKQAASWLLSKLTEAAIDALLAYVRMKLLGF